METLDNTEIYGASFSGDAFKSFVRSFVETHIRADQAELVYILAELDIYDLEELFQSIKHETFLKAVPELRGLNLYDLEATDVARAAAKTRNRKLYDAIRALCASSDEFVDYYALAEELGIDLDLMADHFFVVSPRLATELAAVGESILSFAGVSWWATDENPIESPVILRLAAEAAGIQIETDDQLDLPFVEYRAPSHGVVDEGELEILPFVAPSYRF